MGKRTLGEGVIVGLPVAATLRGDGTLVVTVDLSELRSAVAEEGASEALWTALDAVPTTLSCEYIVKSAERFVVSGEWLQSGAGYEVGYEIDPATMSSFSGGVRGWVSKAAAEHLVSWNAENRDQNDPEDDVLTLSSDAGIVVSNYADDDTFVLGEDAGLYELPGWSWILVDPADCDYVITLTGEEME